MALNGNKANILYDNLMRRHAVTYSGAIVSGFEAINAYDWRDFSIFRAAVGTTNLDTTTDEEETIDCCALWAVARSIVGTVTLQLEESPGVFTTKATFSLVANEEHLAMASFTAVVLPSGRIIRWVIAAGAAVLNIRQMAVGLKLSNPIGQYVGQTPASLHQGFVTTSIISVNGSHIGRNWRRLERKDTLSWEHLERAWVRTYWEPFSLHAARYSFFYQWAPVSFPGEVVLAAAESIDAPVNKTVDRMAVTMPLLCLGKRPV